MIDNFNPLGDLLPSLPLLILLCGGLLLMLLDAFKATQSLPFVTAGILIISVITALPIGGSTEYGLYYNRMIGFGGIASLVHIFLCLSGLFSLFFIQDYLRRNKKTLDEVYSLLIFATIGMVMLANASDLVITFIGLEIMSVCLYIMAGSFSRKLSSTEAALKYFLLGAFATGFLLYGIALLYGLSGLGADRKVYPTTNLVDIAKAVPMMADYSVFYIAVGLVLIGFCFKVAAFPFHNWTPDVYTGAPTPMVGFMATGSKMAAFIAFAFFLKNILPVQPESESHGKVVMLMSLLAVLSMLYGNIVAIQQTNIKRIFAYSSIAHTGYVMLGLCSGALGHIGVIFYMLIYTLMTIGTFGIISIIEHKEEDCELENWKGLGLKYPALGFAMSAFLFSLAGMPPLAGFMGKYFIFGAAIQAELYLPAIIGILSSVIGAYYYLRIIVVMYFQKPTTEDTQPYNLKIVPVAGVLMLVALIIILGVFPSIVKVNLDNLFLNNQLVSLSR